MTILKISNFNYRYFFKKERKKKGKKNMHVWPARMRRWISARPLERNPQRKRNKLSGPGVATWIQAEKELNWKINK